MAFCTGGLPTAVTEAGASLWWRYLRRAVLPDYQRIESRAHALLAGSRFGLGDRLAACSGAPPLHLRSKHVESRLRSKPEQYTRRGDGGRHLRRSPRYDLTRLPRGGTLEETTRLALGA